MSKKKSSSNKKKILKALKPSAYKIYGIFDFDKKALVYVHLSLEQVELEFGLERFDGDQFDIVTFEVDLL